MVFLIVSAWIVPNATATVEFTWNRPAGTPGAETQLNFDCANPDAVHSMYVVFDVPATVTDVVALEIRLQAATVGLVVNGARPPLDPFWHVETAGCNEGAIAVSDDVPADVTGFVNPWGPHGTLGEARIEGMVFAATDPGRWTLDARVDRSSPVALEPGTNYFAVRLDWYLTCAAACGGCDQPVVFALGDVGLVREGGEVVHLDPGVACIAANGGDCTITRPELAFESGKTFSVPVHTGAAICEPVSVRGATWGILKTLYR